MNNDSSAKLTGLDATSVEMYIAWCNGVTVCRQCARLSGSRGVAYRVERTEKGRELFSDMIMTIDSGDIDTTCVLLLSTT